MLKKRTAFLALLALVIQNTLLVILLKLTFRSGAQPYDPATLVLNVELLKFICCFLVVYSRSARDLIDAFREIRNQRLLFLPSALYVLQNNLLIFGMRRLTPIAYIVCTQMKILTTAAASRIVLGSRLSVRQQLSLVFLLFGVILVEMHGNKHEPSLTTGDNDAIAGVTAVLSASLTSGTAGVVLEKIYKQKNSLNLSGGTVWTRNLQLSLISLPVAFIGTISKRYEKRGRFHGYDAILLLVVILQALGGIITGYVLQFANNVLKCLAVSLSICCCAMYSVFINDMVLTPSLVTGILVVNAAVTSYSMSPKGTIARTETSSTSQRSTAV